MTSARRSPSRPLSFSFSFSLSLSLSLTLLALAPPVRADDRERCLEAYVSAQRLRKDKHLIEARDQLLVCMRDVCPEVARSGCAGWLPEVQESLPTAVFAATDGAGKARTDVRLLLDGRAFRERLDGGAVAIDPGEHHLRWELAGETAVDQTIAVREGVKNQQFTVRFPAHVAVAAPTYHRKSSPWMFVLAGVGVVGGAGFAIFGLKSISDENDLRAQCKPNCSSSEVSGVRNEEHVADVSLAIGVAATIGVVVMFATRPKVMDPPRPAAAVLEAFGPGVRF